MANIELRRLARSATLTAMLSLSLMQSKADAAALKHENGSLNLLWSVPQFKMIDVIRHRNGAVPILIEDAVQKKLAILKVSGGGKLGQSVDLSLATPVSTSDLRISSAAGDAIWIAGRTSRRSEGVASALTSNAYLAKVDLSGKVKWERDFPGEGERMVQDVVALPDGGAGVVGRDGQKIWLAVISERGDLQWDTTVGVASVSAIAFVSGAIWISGLDRASSASGQYEVAVWKYTMDGKLIGRVVVEDKLLEKPMPYWSLRFIVDASFQNIYLLSAWTSSKLMPINAVRMDGTASVIWARKLEGSILEDRGRQGLCWFDVALMQSGDLVVSCPTNSSTEFFRLSAATGAIFTMTATSSSKESCVGDDGWVQFLIPRVADDLWTFGFGRGCSWLGQTNLNPTIGRSLRENSRN